MWNNIKQILVLAPHTDDGELGVGATISKFIEEGVDVYYAAFSTAEESVPKGFPKDILKTEVNSATKKLGINSDHLFIYNYQVRKLNYARQEILEDLVTLKRNYNFDLVFLPSLNDLHQDHSTIAIEGLRAFKNSTILGYELIWNNLSFDAVCFFKLEERHINNKITALMEYKSQAHRGHTAPEFVKSLAKTRGVQIGCEWAECFEVIRLIL